MVAKRPTRSGPTGQKKKTSDRPRKKTSRVIKGSVLLLAAAAALGAGIYKGDDGLYLGVVIAMVCGLVGILYVKG